MTNDGIQAFQKALAEMAQRNRAEYVAAGAPYGYTHEGMERWLAERETEEQR